MSSLGTGIDLTSALVAATGGRTGLPGRVVAALVLDGEEAVVEIVDGRVVGAAAADEVAVTVPLASRQLSAFLAGEDSLARAYMRGDLKPVGSSGALLPVVELFEDGQVLSGLAGAAGSA